MAQVDASRFLSNLQTLFAPTIADGQEFTAYIDGDPNSLVIQGENILYPSSGNSHIGELSSKIKNISDQIEGVQSQIDHIDNFCRNTIPVLITNIETISGEFEGTPEFAFDTLYFDIINLREKISILEERINTSEVHYQVVSENQFNVSE